MQFCCLHCRYQIDCLDTEASEIRYFPGGTEVLRIREFQFHKETIPELAIFSIPEVPAHLYASDGVPEIVADAGLRGFDFELVDGPRAAPTGFYTYQNTLLGFQIDIPDTWSVRTWQKGNLTDETGDVPSIFQVSDDDLPRTCDFKHMFVAVLYRPLGQVDIDASVKLSIWRGGDLEEVLMNNLQAQKTEIRQSGTWQCGRETFQYVDTGKIRFFYARADGDLWFYGVIVGQTPSRFDDAVAVMQSMRLL